MISCTLGTLAGIGFFMVGFGIYAIPMGLIAIMVAAILFRGA